MDLAHDLAHQQTEKDLARLERRVRKVYKEAQKDLQAKMDDFTRRFAAKDKIHQQELKDGKITEAEYKRWLSGQIFQGKQWKSKLDQLTDTLVNADQVARKLINGQVYGVFANNANWQAYDLEHGAGINFGFELYDPSTVARLLREQPQLLPPRKVDVPKDQRWSKAKITQQITQGIIQGERLDQIASRLQAVTGMQRNYALTNARTAMTGAQNAGRQDCMNRAKDMGIKVKKEWLATLDHHTRFSHALLDGQSVDMDKPFKSELGPIMYPGDPHAEPANVYNCRCTMIADLVDYPDSFNAPRYDNIDGAPVKGMSYKEWYKAKTGKDLGKPVEKPVEIVKKWAPKFASAQTVKEAVAYAKKFAKKVSFSKVTSVEGMNELNGVLDDLTTRFPIDQLKDLKANGRLTRANARANCDLIEIRTSYLNGLDKNFTDWESENVLRQKRIDQYKALLGDPRYNQSQLKKAIKEYEEDIKYHRWSVSSSVKEGNITKTIAHEYGHVLADQYIGQINGAYANPHYATRRDNPLFQKCVEIEETYKKAMSSGDIYNISRYGATNEYEFFAETFAMYATGEKLPDYIKDMIEGVVKSGKL